MVGECYPEYQGGVAKDMHFQGNRVLDPDYRWQASARYKTGRSELAEGPEILHVSPVTGAPVGLWDRV